MINLISTFTCSQVNNYKNSDIHPFMKMIIDIMDSV